ncbi:BTB/POZ domain-containing protein At5g03250-like [Gastrolobium bilobum]|uniref:BTB/POZ domain-containing protein At5g03250-like n=1 Tax=Gastrolobium bilobum TaxID=150636 RepID=UPI002AAF7685|nr:BTB/POZ domain-containing protein At5g03250-like [Gastrolobium bilobum]
MACMKLGSKSEVFYLDGQSWLCSTGLPSDVIIEIKETSFHLHKFPLISRSEVLESFMKELSSENEKSVLELHDLPGGAKAFLLVAKFCYGVKMELTPLNVVTLRCAAEYLQMTEDYGEGNLIIQTENFLNHIFGYWTDALKALKTCEEVLTCAEELHIDSRCINSLVLKAADPSLVNLPVSSQSVVQSPEDAEIWNGISLTSKVAPGEDWWFEDVSSLSLPLYKRFMQGASTRHMKPEKIAGSLVHYAKKHIPLLGSQSSFQNGNSSGFKSNASSPSEADQRNLIEEIVEFLPNEKGITPTKFLLRSLRTAMALYASSSCCANLERRIGAQLDEADLEDLLIPNIGYSMETLYDIDCVQRMLDHFMIVEHDAIDSTSNDIEEERRIVGGSQSLSPMAKVANMVDGYLAEVAPDVNVKLPKFQSLASVIPDYARTLDDGIYRAIDVYLKAHSWMTDSEKEQICRLMNCQKLSLEASTHAAQNERLPLRVVVQVLFFEQLKLRTSVAGWFFASDNLESSQNLSGNLALIRNDGSITQHNPVLAFDNMKERVSELEKECLRMKQDLEKMMKSKGSWNMILKKLGCTLMSKPSNAKVSKPCRKSKISPASTTPMEEKAMEVN